MPVSISASTIPIASAAKIIPVKLAVIIAIEIAPVVVATSVEARSEITIALWPRSPKSGDPNPVGVIVAVGPVVTGFGGWRPINDHRRRIISRTYADSDEKM